MNDYICHSGIKGMKWGIRNYQNYDGTLTPAGIERYRVGGKDGAHKARGRNDWDKARLAWEAAANAYAKTSKRDDVKVKMDHLYKMKSRDVDQFGSVMSGIKGGGALGIIASAAAFPSLKPETAAVVAIGSAAIGAAISGFSARKEVLDNARNVSMRDIMQTITNKSYTGDDPYADDPYSEGNVHQIESYIDEIRNETMKLRKNLIDKGELSKDRIDLITDPNQALMLAKYSGDKDGGAAFNLITHIRNDLSFDPNSDMAKSIRETIADAPYMQGIEMLDEIYDINEAKKLLERVESKNYGRDIFARAFQLSKKEALERKIDFLETQESDDSHEENYIDEDEWTRIVNGARKQAEIYDDSAISKAILDYKEKDSRAHSESIASSYERLQKDLNLDMYLDQDNAPASYYQTPGFMLAEMIRWAAHEHFSDHNSRVYNGYTSYGVDPKWPNAYVYAQTATEPIAMLNKIFDDARKKYGDPLPKAVNAKMHDKYYAYLSQYEEKMASAMLKDMGYKDSNEARKYIVRLLETV